MLVVLSAGGCGILPSAIEVGATGERFHFAIACEAGIIRLCLQFPRNPIWQVQDSEKAVHPRRVKGQRIIIFNVKWLHMLRSQSMPWVAVMESSISAPIAAVCDRCNMCKRRCTAAGSTAEPVLEYLSKVEAPI